MPDMTNIPTELLRTLVTVVDLRSFTKAAGVLGITQPAVSAQIKRLQGLLGGELLDKSAPGVVLTEKGQLVVAGARRLLMINDQILQTARTSATTRLLRIGIAAALDADAAWPPLGRFRAAPTPWRFEIRRDASEDMLADLEEEEMDLVVALTESEPSRNPRHVWAEPLAWIRGRRGPVDVSGPVPLIACDAKTDLTRTAISVLDRDGRDWEIVCKVPDDASLTAAVAAGLGIAPAARRRAPGEVAVWNDGPLPALPALRCGVYLRNGSGGDAIGDLADAIADAMRPPSTDQHHPRYSQSGPTELRTAGTG